MLVTPFLSGAPLLNKSWIRPCLIKTPGIKTLWQRRKLGIAKTLNLLHDLVFLVLFHCFSLVFEDGSDKISRCMSSFQISSRWIWKRDEAPSFQCCIPKNSENKLRKDFRWTYFRKAYDREMLRPNILWKCIFKVMLQMKKFSEVLK